MICGYTFMLLVLPFQIWGFNAINILKPIIHNYRIAGNTKCVQQLNELKSDFLKGSYWALKMVDSSAKLQSGVLHGNLVQFGNFDECMSMRNEDRKISGKYCLARIPFANLETMGSKYGFHMKSSNLFMKLKNSTIFGLVYGLCIPDGCSAEEMTKLTNNNVLFADFVCQTADDFPKVTNIDVFTMVFFLIVFTTITTSTIYDFYLKYTNKTANKVVYLTFSLYSNCKYLFQEKLASRLGFINGIRSISMLWIIIGHMYSHLYMWGSSNTVDILTFFGKRISMILLSAHMAVDTFLFLSGLLVTYTYLKADKISVPRFYLHRYLRLTAPLAIMVLLHVSLIKFTMNGPLGPVGKVMYVQNCEQYWWSCLLHVQNWINPDNMCTPISWYLSVEMQLVFIAPLILSNLKSRPKRVLSIIILMVCLSMGITFYVVWIYNIGAIYNVFLDANSPFNMQYYYPTYTRASPWLIGVIVGYYLYQIRYQQLKIYITKVRVLILWILTLGIMLTLMLAGHELLFPEEHIPLAHASYLAFAKVIWSAGLGWIVFACANGYGGPIDWFLSLRIFEILSTLSYSMNFIHYTMFGIMLFNKRETTIFSNGRVMYDFIGHYCAIAALSTIWYLVIEKPFLEIGTFVMGEANKKIKNN